jgi:hypothetical protein
MSTKKNPVLLAESNRASMIVKAGSPDNAENTGFRPVSQLKSQANVLEPETQERVFLHLCRGWALGSDQHQWIVLRAKKRGDKSYWNPVDFIATKKSILLRVLAEKGIKPTPEAMAYVDQMPDKFRDWLQVHAANQSCSCLSGVNGKKCRRDVAAPFGFSSREPVQ